MDKIPFTVTDWSTVNATQHAGETGIALWQTLQFSSLRVRIVEYSSGYTADHWCEKGHIVFCLEGTFVTELKTGEAITLTKGMSYIVSDEMSAHRSTSENGVKLLIVDGGFLQ